MFIQYAMMIFTLVEFDFGLVFRSIWYNAIVKPTLAVFYLSLIQAILPQPPSSDNGSPSGIYASSAVILSLDTSRLS